MTGPVPPLSVGVVVPTHGRRAQLPRVLAPLLADPTVEQVVVVVDGYADGSWELVQEMSRTEPRLCPVWQENAGEGRARQTGLEHSTADVVLFIDDDVVAGPGLAAGHLRRHAGLAGAVVLGYMPTRRPDPRRPGQFATVLYADEYESVCRSYEADPSLVLAKLWAGNLSLRRADAERVGMAVDGFGGLAHADAAFGLRCAEAGLTGVFDRELRSTHEHARPLAAFLRDARAQGAGRARLHLADPRAPHGWLAGLSVGAYSRGAGLLVRLPALHRLAHQVGRLALVAAGQVHWWSAETVLAKALRRLEHVRGSRDEQRRQRDARRAPPASSSDRQH